MWPGSDVEIEGRYPTYFYPYDPVITYKERCDVILDWLSYPSSKRPTFLSLYFEEPDHTQHLYGTDDPRVDEAIREVDSYLGYLMSEMNSRNIAQYVDVIVVSDHGMASTSADQTIYLDDNNLTFAEVSQMYDPSYSDVDGWVVTWGAVASIIPAEGREQIIITNLANVPHLTAYTNETISEEENWYIISFLSLNVYFDIFMMI